MESLKKRICIGLQGRNEWGVKLKEVLQGVVIALGIQLSDDELARIMAIPGEVSNLIYAGMLSSFVIEFAGETCEVVLEYYPQADERDDLDLSLLDVVDWEVESITLKILVEDLPYAEEITGPAVMSFCSDRLTVRVEQASGGEILITGEDTEGKDEDRNIEDPDDDDQEAEESGGGNENDSVDESVGDDVIDNGDDIEGGNDNDRGDEERKESEQ